MIRGMNTLKRLIASKMGPNVSLMEINVDMLYIMFFLHGETATTVGSFMPIILETLERSDFVAVAVNATHCTP